MSSVEGIFQIGHCTRKSEMPCNLKAHIWWEFDKIFPKLEIIKTLFGDDINEFRHFGNDKLWGWK